MMGLSMTGMVIAPIPSLAVRHIGEPTWPHQHIRFNQQRVRLTNPAHDVVETLEMVGLALICRVREGCRQTMTLCLGSLHGGLKQAVVYGVVVLVGGGKELHVQLRVQVAPPAERVCDAQGPLGDVHYLDGDAELVGGAGADTDPQLLNDLYVQGVGHGHLKYRDRKDFLSRIKKPSLW